MNSTNAKVGYVIAIFADGSVNSSGATLVGPDLVGTAAHVIFQRNEIGEMAKRIYFVPFGAETVFTNYGTEVFVGKTAPDLVWTEFSYPELQAIDFAFIRLHSPPPLALEMHESDRWFEIQPSKNPQAERFTGDIFSYPWYAPFGSLWHERCPIVPQRESKVLASRCGGVPGRSGSALLESHGGTYRVRGFLSSSHSGTTYFSTMTSEIHSDWKNIVKDRTPSLSVLTRLTLEGHAPFASVLLMVRTNCRYNIGVKLKIFDPTSEDWKEGEGASVRPNGSTPVWSMPSGTAFYYSFQNRNNRWGRWIGPLRPDPTSPIHTVRQDCGR